MFSGNLIETLPLIIDHTDFNTIFKFKCLTNVRYVVIQPLLLPWNLIKLYKSVRKLGVAHREGPSFKWCVKFIAFTDNWLRRVWQMFIPGEHENMKFQKWPFIFKDYGISCFLLPPKHFVIVIKLYFQTFSPECLMISLFYLGSWLEYHVFLHILTLNGRCGPPNAFILIITYKMWITLAVSF